MRDIRFSDIHLNSVLVNLINPSEILVFVRTFKDSRVLINMSSFIESQCRCGILSKHLNIDPQLFSSGRKFMHSVVENTEYHNLSMAQTEFKRLYIIFLQKIAFLNLLVIPYFDTSVVFKGTLPLRMVDFCRSIERPLHAKEGMCVSVSDFITMRTSVVEVVNHLMENPNELGLLLQYVIRDAGALKHLIDYREVTAQFLNRTNPVITHAIVDLYFCMYDEAIWRDDNV